MEYTDKILKVAETIVAGMKSLQKPANLPRAQDNAMAAKRVSAASKGITPNIGVNNYFPFGPPLPTPATGRHNLSEPPPVTPVRVPAAPVAPPSPAPDAIVPYVPGSGAQAPPPPPPATPPPATPPPATPPPATPPPSQVSLQKIRTHYDILGISPGASEDDIKKAFRVKALSSHPNKKPGRTPQEREKISQEFALINLANDILSNPEERAKYNKSLGIKRGGRRNRLTVNRRLNTKRRTTYRR